MWEIKMIFFDDLDQDEKSVGFYETKEIAETSLALLEKLGFGAGYIVDPKAIFIVEAPITEVVEKDVTKAFVFDKIWEVLLKSPDPADEYVDAITNIGFYRSEKAAKKALAEELNAWQKVNNDFDPESVFIVEHKLES